MVFRLCISRYPFYTFYVFPDHGRVLFSYVALPFTFETATYECNGVAFFFSVQICWLCAMVDYSSQ